MARKGASIAEGTEGALMQIDQVRRPDLSKLTPDSVRAFHTRPPFSVDQTASCITA